LESRIIILEQKVEALLESTVALRGEVKNGFDNLTSELKCYAQQISDAKVERTKLDAQLAYVLSQQAKLELRQEATDTRLWKYMVAGGAVGAVLSIAAQIILTVM